MKKSEVERILSPFLEKNTAKYNEWMGRINKFKDMLVATDGKVIVFLECREPEDYKDFPDEEKIPERFVPAFQGYYHAGATTSWKLYSAPKILEWVRSAYRTRRLQCVQREGFIRML